MSGHKTTTRSCLSIVSPLSIKSSDRDGEMKRKTESPWGREEGNNCNVIKHFSSICTASSWWMKGNTGRAKHREDDRKNRFRLRSVVLFHNTQQCSRVRPLWKFTSKTWKTHLNTLFDKMVSTDDRSTYQIFMCMHPLSSSSCVRWCFCYILFMKI